MGSKAKGVYGIEAGRIKGWKRHHRMVLNLVVPTGAVRFVVYDDRADSSSQGVYSDVILSQQNYCRLTVPSGVWMSFQGISNDPSLVMNVSNIMHDPTEVDRKGLDEIDFNWSTK